MARFNFENISMSGRADISLIMNNFNKIEANAALNSDLTSVSNRVTTNTNNITALQTAVTTNTNNIAGKAPNNHASTATTYGLGSGTNYGHTKIINNITTTSYVDGQALSAYQGYVLNTAIATKAPTSHANSASTYGLGTTALYGHCKVINAVNTAQYNDGEALSAYQGKLLNDKVNEKQKAITYGTEAPSGGTAGDIYIQYF